MENFKKSIIVAGAGLILCWCASPGLGQGRFSGLRSHSSNPVAGLREFSGFNASNGMGNFINGSYGLQSRTNSSSFSQPNMGASSGSGRSYRGAMPQFSGPSLINQGNFGLQRNAYSGLSNSGARNSFSTSGRSSMLDLSQPFSEGSNVILLPRSADFYEARNRESDIEAFKPFVDNGLLRSSKGTLPIQTQDIKLNSISTATTTAQGAFYAAQQISRARNYIRQGMYEQALNCYQAARDIDEKNTNSLIGIIYCHIMSGKFQVGGLCVLRLFEQSPDFWRQEPDFIAIFSVSRFDIVKKTLEVEPEIDRLFKLYHVNDGNQVSEDLKQVYLSKTFIAWLKGDSESMKINITAAAKMAPLDGSVQQLYRGLTATK